MRLLRHSLSTGTEPIPMLGALAMRVRNISRAHGARASSTELAQQLGMAPWQAEQAIRDARRFSPAQLAHIVRMLAEADAQLKGEGQDPVYAIERAVLSIAMPGGR
jgi:DNA polymerase III, delta subunit